MNFIKTIPKVFIFVTIISIFVLEGMIWRILIPDMTRRRRKYTRMVSAYGRLCLKFANVHLHVINKPAVTKHNLIVSNHMGIAEILAIATIRPCLFITSVEMKEAPLVGLVTEMAGCLYVERRSRSNIHNEIQDIRMALEQGYNVVLFPEAAAMNGERVYPFKKTLMTAVAGTGIPIQPLVVNFRSVNGEPMSHKWRDHVFWHGDISFGSIFWRMLQLKSIKVDIEFLEEIHCHSEDQRREVAALAHAKIEAKFVPIPRPEESMGLAQSPHLFKLIEGVRQKKLTIGFAESCTGGLLSAAVATVPGVSDFFLGSVVGYSNEVKLDLLGVQPETLKLYGAVSEQTAREMAAGACQRLKVDCSVAITGVAGPTGGTHDKPVGTVWFAIKGPGFEKVDRKLFAGSRQSIQQQSAEHAMHLLLNALRQGL